MNSLSDSGQKPASPDVAGKSPDVAAELKPIEAHAAELGTHPGVLAAAKHHRKWGQGREVTRKDFEAACAEVLSQRVAVSFPHPV